jgi:hypothetical protein
MPVRIQRRRTAGWKRPLGAVIVDRTSRYGNPFRVDGPLVELIDGRTLACSSPAAARQVAVEQFEAWLHGYGPDTVTVGRKTFDRRRVLAAIKRGALRGKDLACPCEPPEPGEPDHCHAAVLLERAAATKGAQR